MLRLSLPPSFLALPKAVTEVGSLILLACSFKVAHVNDLFASFSPADSDLSKQAFPHSFCCHKVLPILLPVHEAMGTWLHSLIFMTLPCG